MVYPNGNDEITSSSDDDLGPVRVRAQRPDPYAGLKGHSYIAARGLQGQVQRVQTSAHELAKVQAEARDGL